MKKILLLLTLIGFSVHAVSDVRPQYSGAWYNPDQSGHGFSIDVISPERSIAFWYAYDPFGNPIFLLADGVNVGDTIQAQVSYFYGMQFGNFDPSTLGVMDWGTLTITFEDCQNATLKYESVLEYETGDSFGSGELPLYHLASIDGFKCSDYPLAGVYSGFARSNNDGSTSAGYGIISETGELNFFSTAGVVANGLLTTDGGSSGKLSASGSSLFFHEGLVIGGGNFNASGNFNPDLIGMDYSTPVETGFLEVNKLSQITSSSVSMEDISGNWIAYSYITGESLPVTIRSDGSFSLVDGFGCDYSGAIKVANPELSILDVSANVSGCSVITGSFKGHGAYIENENIYANGEDVILLIAWSEDENAAVMRLTPN